MPSQMDGPHAPGGIINLPEHLREAMKKAFNVAGGPMLPHRFGTSLPNWMPESRLSKWSA